MIAMMETFNSTVLEFIDMIPVGVVVTDDAGYMVHFNPQAAAMLSLNKTAVKYIRLEEACPGIYRDGKLRKEAVFRTGEGRSTYKVTAAAGGSYKAVFIEDISRQTYLAEENDLLKTVLDAIHEGVQISDEKGVTVLYNKACERFEGMKKEDVIGKKIIDVYDVTEETSVHRSVYRTGKGIVERQHRYHTCDGHQVEVVASTLPYFAGKEVAYVYSINRDVTKMKEFLSKTIELQRRLSTGDKGKAGGNSAYYTFDDIIGTSKAIKDVVASARKIALNNSSVLIYGETGTGKELFAQSIHNASLNARGPFIAINCAAIPETLLESLLFGTVKGAFTGAVESQGLFEQAENGTLYLDEINSMGLHLQAKLLRVIQEKSMRRIGDSVQRNVNCRIISSTNKEPQSAVNDQQIRKDLYYRLAAVTLFIPPLTERIEDVQALVDYFIKKYNKQFGTGVTGISPQLQEAFDKYSWPGNVRELEHVIESAFNMVEEEKTLQMEHLAVNLRKRFTGQLNHIQQIENSPGLLNEILQDVEKRTIIRSLQKNKGNISQTAKELGIFRQALQYRMKRYNINLNGLEETEI